MSTVKIQVQGLGRWFEVALTRQKYTQRGHDTAASESTGRLPAGLSAKEKRVVCRNLAIALSTYCQHSYDCCGRWYHSACTQYKGRKVSIRWSHVRNV